MWRALREHLSERFLGDGVEIVSHAGWIAAEQDMRRHSNQSRYNCKYLVLTPTKARHGALKVRVESAHPVGKLSGMRCPWMSQVTDTVFH